MVNKIEDAKKNIAIISDTIKYKYPEINSFMKEKIFSSSSLYQELQDKLISTINSWYKFTFQEANESCELYHLFLYLYDMYQKEMEEEQLDNEKENIESYLKKVIAKTKYVKKRLGEINRKEYTQIAQNIDNRQIDDFVGKEKNKLFNFALSYMSMQEQTKNFNSNKYDNIIDCISDIYNQIDAWHLSKNSFLTEYNFFNNLTLQKQYDYLLYDLKICLLETIKKEFQYDVNKTTISIPKDITSHPYFYLQNNTSIELMSELIEVNGKNMYKGVEHLDEYASVALNDAIPAKSGVKITASPLNAIDLGLYINIYNKINLSTFKDPYIYTSLSELCNEMFGEQEGFKKKKKRYLQTTYESIQKLLNSKLCLEGESKEKKHLLYIDLLGEFTEIVFNTSIKDTNSAKYYEQIQLKIAIPQSMLSLWENKKNDIVMTKVYNQISSSQSRALFCFIQTERIKQYSQQEEHTKKHIVTISLSTFKQRFNFAHLKPNRMIAIINDTLEDLKENNIGILDFWYDKNNKNYIIEMLPFSEIEKQIYNISTIVNLENKQIEENYQWNLYDFFNTP